MTKQCANCEELIGNLETSYQWGEHSVCNRCFRVLSTRAAAASLMTPVATPVVPQITPPPADLIPTARIADTLDALAVAAATKTAKRPRARPSGDRPNHLLPWVTAFLAVAIAVLIVVLVVERFPPGIASDISPPASVPLANAPAEAMDIAAGPVAAPVAPTDLTPRDAPPPIAKMAADDIPASPPPDTVRPTAVPGRGQVQFTVVWKANDFGGNEGDAGAVALLIPKTLKEKLPSSAINPDNAEILLDDTRKVLAPFGAYIAIVGGDGTAIINGVAPGAYNVVILSKDAHDDLEGQQQSQTQLQSFFDADTATTTSKVFLSEVNVSAGNEVDISHDFGHTAS